MEADGPAPADVDALAEIFEKTLLEVSILDSLHGSSAASYRVKRVFRASVQDLRESGTLKTLAAAMAFVDGGRVRRRGTRSRDGCAEREPSPRGDVESLEKRLRALRRNVDEVDLMTEKCIVSVYFYGYAGKKIELREKVVWFGTTYHGRPLGVPGREDMAFPNLLGTYIIGARVLNRKRKSTKQQPLEWWRLL